MVARAVLLFLVACAAASFAGAPPAHAQCRLCDKPEGGEPAAETNRAIELNVEAGLDFDRLVVVDAREGSALLRPDGSRQVAGSVQAISGRAMVGEARVRGEPGRSVRIDLPDRIELYSVSGARITIDEIATDLPSLPRLDSAGNLLFRFGGRVRVSGNSDGDFRGDLPITVEYL